jgi:hypothetical protein
MLALLHFGLLKGYARLLHATFYSSIFSALIKSLLCSGFALLSSGFIF